jgi:hypothetical protein
MKLRLSIKIVMMMAMLGVLAAVVIPGLIKARTTRSINTCIDINLWAIADAKKRWAEVQGKAHGSVPQQSDLLPYLPGGKFPICPAGGTYFLGPVGSNPWCSLTNKHPWNPVRL